MPTIFRKFDELVETGKEYNVDFSKVATFMIEHNRKKFVQIICDHFHSEYISGLADTLKEKYKSEKYYHFYEMCVRAMLSFVNPTDLADGLYAVTEFCGPRKNEMGIYILCATAKYLEFYSRFKDPLTYLLLPNNNNKQQQRATTTTTSKLLKNIQWTILNCDESEKIWRKDVSNYEKNLTTLIPQRFWSHVNLINPDVKINVSTNILAQLDQQLIAPRIYSADEIKLFFIGYIASQIR